MSKPVSPLAPPGASGLDELAIEELDLIHARIPLREPFRISSGTVTHKDALLVRIQASGVEGWGESSPMEGSFYSSDTPASCWNELCTALAPAALARGPSSVDDFLGWLSGVRVSPFARAGIETAVWEWQARMLGQPLCTLLGATPRSIASGLAIGLYESVEQTIDAARRWLEEGYGRVKLKIEPGRDIALVRAFRKAFPDLPLWVDANGGYRIEHLDTLRVLDDFGLLMIEQPFAPAELEQTAQLAASIRTPICLDESLETLDDLQRAVTLGAVRIVNLKIQRVGGLGPALDLHRAALAHGLSVWVGTMPELGIGSAHALALAAVDGSSFPTDVESSHRWFVADIVEPALRVRDGCFAPFDGPGLGVDVDLRALQRWTIAERRFPGRSGQCVVQEYGAVSEGGVR